MKEAIHDKVIYLLIGPKGSGKSLIGSLMDDNLGIKFIRVEDLVKAVRRDRKIMDQSYIKEAFQTIENGVREALDNYDKVVFESVGLTDSFDQMLKNLRRDFSVVTIRILANEDLCLQRVKTRDQSIHINISDDEVNGINRQIKGKDIKTDYILTNENKSANQLIEEIKTLICQSE